MMHPSHWSHIWSTQRHQDHLLYSFAGNPATSITQPERPAASTVSCPTVSSYKTLSLVDAVWRTKKHKLSFQPVHFMTLSVISKERVRWGGHHLILMINLICPSWLEHLFLDVANRKLPSNPPTDFWLTDRIILSKTKWHRWSNVCRMASLSEDYNGLHLPVSTNEITGSCRSASWQDSGETMHFPIWQTTTYCKTEGEAIYYFTGLSYLCLRKQYVPCLGWICVRVETELCWLVDKAAQPSQNHRHIFTLCRQPWHLNFHRLLLNGNIIVSF